MTGHSVTGSEVIASVPFVCAANKFKVPFLQAIWENSLSRNRLAKFAKLPVEKIGLTSVYFVSVLFVVSLLAVAAGLSSLPGF